MHTCPLSLSPFHLSSFPLPLLSPSLGAAGPAEVGREPAALPEAGPPFWSGRRAQLVRWAICFSPSIPRWSIFCAYSRSSSCVRARGSEVPAISCSGKFRGRFRASRGGSPPPTIRPVPGCLQLAQNTQIKSIP